MARTAQATKYSNTYLLVGTSLYLTVSVSEVIAFVFMWRYCDEVRGTGPWFVAGPMRL